MLIFNFYPYDLKFSEVFAVAGNARTGTDIIYVELAYDGKIGYGEASFPPYMKEKREDNLLYLSQLDFSRFESPFLYKEIYDYMDHVSPMHTPAKAAIDMALLDLQGKLKGVSVGNMLAIESSPNIYTSFTIGIGEADFILRQLKRAADFSFIKVKLNGDILYNKNTVELIQRHSNQALGVDFNGGFTDKELALEMIDWLAEKKVAYVEQPLPISLENNYIFLKEKSPLDIYGDESIQNEKDLIEKHHLFDGVNVKLMKCGGVKKAHEMVLKAKDFQLKTMLGCMAESSVAISAAAQLAPLFDRVDLDGNLMVANEIFKGVSVENGRLVFPTNHKMGLGTVKI